MDDIGQLRIYVEEKQFPVYHTISGGNLFKQNSEFFIFCVFVGEANERIEPIQKRRELCRAITLTDYDKTAIKALYLKYHDHLSSTKEMIEFAEVYANGGFNWFAENHPDLFMQDVSEQRLLKDSCEEQLQLLLIEYVLAKKQEVPF